MIRPADPADDCVSLDPADHDVLHWWEPHLYRKEGGTVKKLTLFHVGKKGTLRTIRDKTQHKVVATRRQKERA